MKRKKYFLKDKNLILALGIVYLLLTILATISYVSYINRVSTTTINIINIVSTIWWQLLMILLFLITYLLYNNKQKYAALLEVIMGLSMFAYIIVSIVTMGVNLLSILFEIIYPIILIYHGYKVMKKINKKTR